MLEVFHTCYASHDEVLFRNSDDYLYAENSLAISLHDTNSKLLSHALMSDHVHTMLLTENPSEFMRRFRISTTKHLNNKYSRKGGIGDKGFFCSKIEGQYHIIAAASYILRNPLHHGVCNSPFAYPYSSIHNYFKKDLFQTREEKCLSPNHIQYPRQFLSRNRAIPDGYKLSTQGIILKDNYVETALIEHYYTSPRRFLYYMNRLSNEEWLHEQEKDINVAAPIRLDSIEDISRYSMSTLLANENGRFKPVAYDDMYVCNYIDSVLVQRYRKPSYFLLTNSEKKEAAEILKRQFYIGEKQIIRCLGVL